MALERAASLVHCVGQLGAANAAIAPAAQLGSNLAHRRNVFGVYSSRGLDFERLTAVEMVALHLQSRCRRAPRNSAVIKEKHHMDDIVGTSML